ncbi:hypothetical protein ACIGXM_29235 [Kitasatospora sp. NPDC052896]|uniref:hypothetical protein n=1 Tax=Kitasatospora sp. NPDC052896 TaxID=3364061 RepID=UPI0037C9DF60
MRVLAYEGRRLFGLRSTWLILAAALLTGAAVTAVLAHQSAPGPLPVTRAVRLLTASVPLLPIPLAALAAGALGALASAHEVQYPGLAASQSRYGSRVRLLLGKLAVSAVVSAGLAMVSLLLDAAVLQVALRPVTSADRLFSPALLRTDQRPVLVLVFFAALVVAAGWTGVLAAALTRSALAGLLLLCALPLLVEPLSSALLQRGGPVWVARTEAALPFQHPLEQLYESATAGRSPQLAAPLAALVETTQPLALIAFLVPAALLLVVCLLAQLHRRSY